MNSRSLSRWWTRSAVAGSASPPATAASARRAASRASGHFCSFSSRSTSPKIDSTSPATFACRSPCCRAASASRADRSRTAQPTPLPKRTRKNSTSAATASPPRFRRANFRSRYPADGGQASTGSSAR